MLFSIFELRFAGVVNHTVFAIWVGYFLARQRDETIWGIEMGCGWLLAVFLHGLFDYFAMSGQVAPLIALFILYNIIGCYAVCCYNIQDFVFLNQNFRILFFLKY